MQSGYRVAVVLIMMLGVSACSESATTTTTSAPATTVPDTTSPATTAPPTTTPPPPPTTTSSTSSTVAVGTVGDPAALQALAEQVAADSLIPIDEFFIPNITQPDPIEALKELIAYSHWMATTFPDKELAKLHTIENSPARTLERNVVDPLESFGLAIRPVTPYVNDGFRIAEFDELPTTDTTKAGFPAGSVAIRYLSTSDGYDVVDEDTGVIDSTVPPWTELQIYVVVAPTEFGWQEYWYGTP